MCPPGKLKIQLDPGLKWAREGWLNSVRVPVQVQQPPLPYLNKVDYLFFPALILFVLDTPGKYNIVS